MGESPTFAFIRLYGLVELMFYFFYAHELVRHSTRVQFQKKQEATNGSNKKK